MVLRSGKEVGAKPLQLPFGVVLWKHALDEQDQKAVLAETQKLALASTDPRLLKTDKLREQGGRFARLIGFYNWPGLDASLQVCCALFTVSLDE